MVLFTVEGHFADMIKGQKKKLIFDDVLDLIKTSTNENNCCSASQFDLGRD